MDHYTYFLSIVMNTEGSLHELENLFLKIVEKYKIGIISMLLVISDSPNHIHAIIISKRKIYEDKIYDILGDGFSVKLYELYTLRDLKNVTRYIETHEGKIIDINYSNYIKNLLYDT